MPKIFEYLGLIIRFWSDEHEPIHIHAFYNDCQTKVEFLIKEGIVEKITYRKVKGYESLPNEKLKDLKVFVEAYKYEIIQLWIKHFVMHEKIKCRKINKKLK